MAKEKHLHIVSFDIPFPANYGGVIDVFFKLKALSDAGVKIHLHCYEYGRNRSQVLEDLCVEVNYYKRKISKRQLINTKPYVVLTRNSQELINNLCKDKHPILFEGLHCTYFLNSPRIKRRKKIVRTHNVEHDYYAGLAKVESNIFKKYYFLNESLKLKLYEDVLLHANHLLTISKADFDYFSSRYKRVHLIHPFHENKQIISQLGMGDYALYHGNLSIGENNNAVLFLIREVFSKIQFPLVIAGSKPTFDLIELVKKYPHIELIPNPDQEKMDELMQRAHIHILTTSQNTGLKLKLINSLYQGRWCICNATMCENSGLEDLCIVKNTPQEMMDAIEQMSLTPFVESEIMKRETILKKAFNNQSNLDRLLSLIF